MTNKWFLLILFLLNIFYQINSRDSSLQCWRCEVRKYTTESPKEPEILVDSCQAQFDFTEHTLEDCDGKCWKVVDLLDMKRLGNSSIDRFKLKDAALSSLTSTRRCFSADELIRANEMGINTANGCRKLKRENEKSQEICFCSDQDMCNKVKKLTQNSLFIFILLFVYFYYHF